MTLARRSFRLDAPELMVVVAVLVSLALGALRDGRARIVVLGSGLRISLPEEPAWPPGTRWARADVGSEAAGLGSALASALGERPAAVVIRLDEALWADPETPAQLAGALAVADDRRIGVALFVPASVAGASPPHPLCAGAGLSLCVVDPQTEGAATTALLLAAGLDALTRRDAWRASTQIAR